MSSPNWRPWSPKTDWAQGDALRYLNALVALNHQIARSPDTTPTSLRVAEFFRDGSGHNPYGERNIVLCLGDGRIKQVNSEYRVRPHRHWGSAGRPQRCIDQGNLRLLTFADGSGLALRRHTTRRGFFALPTNPFVGDPTGIPPDLLWQPCLDPLYGHLVADLLPHELVLPTYKPMTANERWIPKLETVASMLAALFPGMPYAMKLGSGTGREGPFYVFPTYDDAPQLAHVLDGMTRLARAHLPGRHGLSQVWDSQVDVDQDPRAPVFWGTHRTVGGTPTTAHHRMTLLGLLAHTQDAPNLDAIAMCNAA